MPYRCRETNCRKHFSTRIGTVMEYSKLTPVSDKGMRVRPHGLVWRCGKAVERVLLWPAIWAIQPLPQGEGEVPINPNFG